jgi:hypothetical protein
LLALKLLDLLDKFGDCLANRFRVHKSDAPMPNIINHLKSARFPRSGPAHGCMPKVVTRILVCQAQRQVITTSHPFDWRRETCRFRACISAK